MEKDTTKKEIVKKESVKQLMDKPEFQNRFKEILGKQSATFISSVLAVANNESLKNVEPISIVQSAMMAATLNLPINQNLGFAYIVPYQGNAQFQVGWRGLVQLAQRSGQFKTLNVTDVRDGEIKEINHLTGEVCFSWIDISERENKEIIGYVAYFELLNGFNKMLYMSKKNIDKHAKKYSQTYKKNYGNWVNEFDAMAKKTVLKLLLSKYAPLSIEMQRAIISDQSVIHNSETLDVEYVDNKDVYDPEKVEKERVISYINNAKTISELKGVADEIVEKYGLHELYEIKFSELTENEM